MTIKCGRERVLKMAKKIIITPNKCNGCMTCALTCSITYNDEFDLSKSHIQIETDDFNGVFKISYLSTCYNCCKCSDLCPTKCLETITISEAKEGDL